MLKNIKSTLITILIILFIFEFFLRINGRYNQAYKYKYVISKSIFEPQPKTHIVWDHPDLKNNVVNNYDELGVNNFFFEIDTSKKKNIIGIFGDSFAENIFVFNEYRIDKILQKLFNNKFEIVNYGVNGYGLDQIFLRYEKYKNNDLKKIVYIFIENDFRNLYENQLVEYDVNGALKFREIKINKFYFILNKIHLSYFFLEFYYILNAMKVYGFKTEVAEGTIKWLQSRDELKQNFSEKFLKESRNQRKRLEDYYASSMLREVIDLKPSKETMLYLKKFNDLLSNLNEIIKRDNREFLIVVGPRPIDTVAFKSIVQSIDNYNVLFLEEKFLNIESFAFRDFFFNNDYHWNELGNLYAAKFIFDKLMIGVGINKIGNEIDQQDKIIDSYLNEIKNIYKCFNTKPICNDTKIRNLAY